MNKIIPYILIVVTTILTSGCSPIVSKYKVSIDAITAPNLIVTPKTYTIKALGKDTDTNSLKFQQQASILDKLLQKEGYKKVNSESLAQEIIFFDYGIEKVLDKVEEYIEPSVTMGISIGNAYGRYYSPFWNDFGYYRSYRKRYKYYNRYITLLAKNRLGKELWRVDTSSIGESKNLKKIVPILLEASIPYIGKNTKEPVKVVIKEKKAKKE